MADWLEAFHEIEVAYFEDEDVRGDYKGCAWMDKDTLHVEMNFRPPVPLRWVPYIDLAVEVDDG